MKTKLIPMIIGAFVISKQEKYLQQIRGIRRIRDLYAENKKEQKDKILNPQFFRSLVEDLKNPENKATYRGREIFFFFKQKYEKFFLHLVVGMNQSPILCQMPGSSKNSCSWNLLEQLLQLKDHTLIYTYNEQNHFTLHFPHFLQFLFQRLVFPLFFLLFIIQYR